jgi:dimethylaniline monooxygenase (N-oxide forming)
MKVGIIGAGLSGLVTAKTLLEYGHEVIVFEKEKEVGGVWASSRHYPGMTTQNTRDTYALSDFPMPSDYPEFPTGDQILKYLTAYAEKNNLVQCIHFESTIINTRLGDNGDQHFWVLEGVNSKSGAFTFMLDFLVVCSGTFSTPNIPHDPSANLFTSANGQILHTTQIASCDFFKNKNVAVIGYGKSACDVASTISDSTKETYLIFRELKWKVPKKIMGINYKYFILTRFGEALTKLNYRTFAEKIIHSIRVPKIAFRLFQTVFNFQQGLKKTNLYPQRNITDFLYGELSIESDGFFENIKNGKITPVKSEVKSFFEEGLVLDQGEKIKVDAVIYGTGFSQEIGFFQPEIKKSLLNEGGDYLLYRNILPIYVPNLAFVGYNTSFFCNLSSEIAALWLAEYMKGNINVPLKEDMLSQIHEHHQWRKKFRMNSWYNGTSVYPFNLTYVDWLLEDMNDSLSWWALLYQWLVVVEPSHYRGVKRRIKSRH